MPHVLHSGEPNGKTGGFDWYSRCRRIKRKRKSERNARAGRGRFAEGRGEDNYRAVGEEVRNTADGGKRLDTARL